MKTILYKPVNKTLNSRLIKNAVGKAVIFSIFFVDLAIAQDMVLEEITVTARRRSESLQETPIAVTAFTKEAIQNSSMDDIGEIGLQTPNLTQTAGLSGSTSAAAFFIRGIGQADFTNTTDAGVGIYVDGVYFPRAAGSLLDIVDIERVEVLKGPQGTLFGKNTIGGAINVVTTRPDDEFKGDVSITIGSRDRKDFKGSVDIPLIPGKLFARVSGGAMNQDGYGKFVRLDRDAGSTNSSVLRGTLRWLPSENSEVLFSMDNTTARQTPSPISIIAIDTSVFVPSVWNGLVVPNTPGAPPSGPQWIPSNPLNSFGEFENVDNLDAWGISLTGSIDFENFSVKSITSYRDTETAFGWDLDSSPAIVSHQSVADDGYAFNQELQFSGSMLSGDRLEWLLGLYYFEEKFNSFVVNEFATGAFALGGPDLDSLRTTKTDNSSYAVFGNVNFRVNDSLRVSGGVRWTSEEKGFFADLRRPVTSSGTVLIPGLSEKDTFTSVSPKISIDYSLNNDVLLYVSQAKGFRSGAFNGRPLETASIGSVEPEIVWTTELGMKGDFLDNRLRLNLAAFRSDYTDIQVTAVSTQIINGVTDTFVVLENAAEAEVYGFEGEFVALPLDGMTVSGGVGYIHNEITKVDNNVTVVNTDSNLTFTPKWTANLAVQQVFQMKSGASLTVRGDWSHSSAYDINIQNDSDVRENGYDLFNARITYKPSSERWQFAIFGKNLSDELYHSNGLRSTFSGGSSIWWSRPREWGAELSFNF